MTTVTLGDISAFITKGATPTTYGFQWQTSGVPFLRSECVSEHGLDMRQAMRISPQANQALRRSQVQDGDILMTITGYVGRVIRLAGIGSANINQHIARIRIKDRGFDSGYVYHYLAQRTMREYYETIVTGQAYPQISLVQVRETRLPAVPLSEQRGIASALDDADSMIVSLERLIAKKQAIKQGMMQQLLGGHTRLPGFHGQWRALRLGDVLTVRHGKSQRAVEVSSGKYPILATGGQIGWTNTPLYSKPSVLIGRKGTIDRPQFQNRPFWTVDTLFYTEISQAADPRFLYYKFLTVDWRSMNEASGVPSLSSTRIEGVEVKLPEIAEQVAIREALDDADQEIAVLHERLDKARDLKVGMMQQLLTGRKRLPAEVLA